MDYVYIVLWVIVIAAYAPLALIADRADLLRYAWILPMQVGAIVAHEFGHVIGSWLVGARVGRVELGIGPQLLRLRLGSMTIRIGPVLLRGSVGQALGSMRAWRARRVDLTAAGPATNLLLLLLALSRLQTESFTSDIEVVLWRCWAIANFLLVISSLFPASHFINEQRRPSDGSILLTLIFHRPSESELAKQAAAESHAFIMLGEYGRAVDFLREHMMRWAHNDDLLMQLAFAQIGAEQLHDARQNLRTVLDRRKEQDEATAISMNNLAWVDLMIGTEDALAEAQDLSREALALCPWRSACQGTRGGVLVVTGDVEEGLKLLRQAQRGARDPWSIASVLSLMALAEHARGNVDASQRFLRRAERSDSRCEAIKVVKRRMAERVVAQSRPAIMTATH